MRILIVDDDEDVALLCRMSLQGVGHDVITAGSGREALALLEDTPADLIVLDGMLPDIDGLDLLGDVTGSAERAGAPVVMVSARVGSRDQLAALERGATAYLTKPFDPAQFVRLVHEIASLNEAERDARRVSAIEALHGAREVVRKEVKAERSARAPSDALSRVLSLAFDAIVSIDEDQRIVGFNKGAESIFGYLAEEVVGKPIDLLVPERLTHAHRQHVQRFADERDAGRLMGEQRKVFGRRRDGSEFPAEASITKLDIDGRPVLTAILRDATERQRTEDELRARALQQAAVAELGQQAVAGATVPALLNDAAEMLQRVLDVEYALVLTLEPDGESLLLAAGAGWPAGLVGHARVPAGRDSHAGYTLRADRPTIFTDISEETRFRPTDLLRQHGIVSGASVALLGRASPYGTIGVHATTTRVFAADDIHFLQAVANIIASAVQREKDEQRLRAFLDAAPDATLMVAADGRIVSANAQAEALFGYPREELLRLTVDSLVPDAVRAQHGSHRARYARERRTRPMGAGLVLAARRKDGTEVPVDIMLRPLDTDEGPLVIAAIRDVTDRRRNEATRDAFLHAVSHELRTPLTSVIGFAGLLARGRSEKLSEEAADLVGRIELNALKLERLLSDLLDLDRLARGVLEARRRPVPIKNAIRRTVDSLQVGDHPVTVEVQPGDLEANVDPAQFERIIENLVVNASRHTPPGTAIDITATPSANGLLVTVDDRGLGVPDVSKSAVFEPFQRAEPGALTPGTGIGLSLIARFAELHGGRAWVEDRPGGGASFRVVLAD